MTVIPSIITSNKRTAQGKRMPIDNLKRLGMYRYIYCLKIQISRATIVTVARLEASSTCTIVAAKQRLQINRTGNARNLQHEQI